MDLVILDKRIKCVSTRVRNINLGGCGVFALELSRILSEECGIGCDILYTGFGKFFIKSEDVLYSIG